MIHEYDPTAESKGVVVVGFKIWKPTGSLSSEYDSGDFTGNDERARRCGRRTTPQLFGTYIKEVIGNIIGSVEFGFLD